MTFRRVVRTQCNCASFASSAPRLTRPATSRIIGNGVNYLSVIEAKANPISAVAAAVAAAASVAAVAATASMQETSALGPNVAHCSGRDDSVDGLASLESHKDHYGGRIVPAAVVVLCGTDAVAFKQRLEESLNAWRQSGVRGVWLEIPCIQAAALLAPALQQGFELHHVDTSNNQPDAASAKSSPNASACSVTLTYWFPGEKGEPNTLPPGNSHTVGVGAVVINAAGQLLAVQERSGPAAALNEKTKDGFWKMPTGLVSAGEDACTAATREVLEETGVAVVVEKLVGVREAHNPRGTSTNMFLVFLCRPADENQLAIRKQEAEILRCEWMDADEFLQRQGKIMRPGSLYYRLNELAVHVARSGGHAMGIHELPIGFRPGTNRAYFSNPNSIEEHENRSLPKSRL